MQGNLNPEFGPMCSKIISYYVQQKMNIVSSYFDLMLEDSSFGLSIKLQSNLYFSLFDMHSSILIISSKCFAAIISDSPLAKNVFQN